MTRRDRVEPVLSVEGMSHVERDIDQKNHLEFANFLSTIGLTAQVTQLEARF
jgi:hypothetical protein